MCFGSCELERSHISLRDQGLETLLANFSVSLINYGFLDQIIQFSYFNPHIQYFYGAVAEKRLVAQYAPTKSKCRSPGK